MDTRAETSVPRRHKPGDGPIFIVGAPRSGTTLLQYMLRSHPRISLPTGESHFIVPLYRNAATFGDLTKIENIRTVLAEMYRRSADFLDTDLHGFKFDIDTCAKRLHSKGCNTLPDIVAGLFSENAAGEGKIRWGDKTPYYVLHLPKILDWFPDAQVIHLVRDGRDCALSLFSRRHDFRVYNTYHAAKYWQQYVEAGRAWGLEAGGHIYLEIRYEDILADPAKALHRVCEFLDEEYSDMVVNFKKAGEAGKTPLVQRSVQSENTQKWRQSMSLRQIRVFESAAGDTLEACGYPVTTSTRRMPLPLRGAYRLHNRAVSWFYRVMR